MLPIYKQWCSRRQGNLGWGGSPTGSNWSSRYRISGKFPGKNKLVFKYKIITQFCFCSEWLIGEIIVNSTWPASISIWEEMLVLTMVWDNPNILRHVMTQGSTLRVVRSSNPTSFVLWTSWVDDLVVQFQITVCKEISVSAKEMALRTTCQKS